MADDITASKDACIKINASLLKIVGIFAGEFPENEMLEMALPGLRGPLQKKPEYRLIAKQLVPMLKEYEEDIRKHKEDVIMQRKIKIFDMINLHELWPSLVEPKK